MAHCKECYKELSDTEIQKYEGYCQKCYGWNHENEKPTSSFKKSYSNISNNIVANVIKIIAIISAIAGVILGFIFEEEIIIKVVIIVIACISSTFAYALGEIIQLLEDIKNK